MKWQWRAAMVMGLVGGILPLAAQAHVKWFVNDQHAFTEVAYQPDSLFIAILVGAGLFLWMAVFLQRKAESHAGIYAALYQPLLRSSTAPSVAYLHPLLKSALGVLLLANILQGHFVAPHFVEEGEAVHYALLQALLVLLLIMDGGLFAIAFLVFSSSLLVAFPVERAIDYAPEFIALSLALGLTSPRLGAYLQCLEPRLRLPSFSDASLAIALLQYGLGLQLIILTFHDKLLHPGYGLAFLQEYPAFNFPRYFGWQGFSDSHFVFGAAVAELCFGLLLVANIAPRLAAVLIVMVFSLTGLVLGPEELLGHVPIIAMASALVLTPLSRRMAAREPLQVRWVSE